MKKKKICFIVNPFSGVNKKQNLEDRLLKRLDLQQYTYKIYYTEYAGHAVELAAQAIEEEFDIVVAVGGDGSINEVAQSLIDTEVVYGGFASWVW